MCYPCGSDQPTGPCPMCKVFKPSGSRCPHIRDICYNRALHPRFDVLFIKNAEVQSFNGCGYCKWARTNPPAKLSGYQNPGWPGCCRPPSASEQRFIQAADWRAVNIVHHTPIPSEIKSILDSLSPRGSPVIGSSPLGRMTGVQPTSPLLDRKNSNNSSSTKSSPISSRSQPMSIPIKGRPGGSPQQRSSSLMGPNSFLPGTPSSLPNASDMEQYFPQRRPANPEHGEKLRNSPVRRHAELEAGSTSRRNSGSRTSLSSVFSAFVATNCPPETQIRPSLHRRASMSCAHSPAVKSTSPSSRPSDLQNPVATRTSAKKADLEDALAALEITSVSSSSSGSTGSIGSGSLSDNTVTSDGGFTDYLSDESEAELQRQAEAKAALVAQNQAEELEFKAVRQQLAQVDLRPPKSWNATANSSTRIQFSSHAPSYSQASYTSASFGTPVLAHAAPQSRG